MGGGCEEQSKGSDESNTNMVHSNCEASEDPNKVQEVDEVDSSADAEQVEYAVNPMLDPVILKHLFKVCDLSDLRRCRLVCTLWYELSLPQWRAKAPLVIGSTQDRYGNGRDHLPWREAPILYESEMFSVKPFQKYCLWDVTCAFCDEDEENEDHPDGLTKLEFWKECGPSMRTLELHFPQVDCLESLRKIIFEMTPNLETLYLRVPEWNLPEQGLIEAFDLDMIKSQPNLKHLKVQITPEEFPNIWHVLFTQFPNIEHLEFVGLVDYGWTQHLSMILDALQLLQVVPERNKWKPIKHLDIFNVEQQHPGIVRRLLSLNRLKLESLRFSVSSCEFRQHSVLHLAIQLHGETLKKLSLRNLDPKKKVNAYENFPFSDVCLTSLSELHLEGNVLANLNFLKQTPNLRVFHVLQDGQGETGMIDRTEEAFLENLVLPKVSEFHYYFLPKPTPIGIKLDEKKMEMITRVMPNVTRLKAALSMEALQIVCEKWKDMKSLEIFTEELDDVSIMGFEVEGEERVPNLTDLKYLQQVSIEGDTTCTDTSIFNGFLKMYRLHSLKVTMSENTSNEAFEALRKRFPGAEIKRRISESGSPIENIEKEKLNSKLEAEGKQWRREYGCP